MISNPEGGTGNHPGPKQQKSTTTGAEGKQSLPKSKVGLGQKIRPAPNNKYNSTLLIEKEQKNTERVSLQYRYISKA